MMELSLVAKATVALGLGLFATHLTRHARASVRHVVLAATFASLLVLPLAAALVPTVAIEVPMTAVAQTAAARGVLSGVLPVQTASAPGPARVVDPAVDRLALATVLGIGWAAGMAALFVWLGAGIWQLRRVRRRGVPWLEGAALARAVASDAGIHRPVDVLIDERLAAPLTCGLLRPAIVFPPDARDWNTADVERALLHELEHVRRGDWPVQMLTRGICAIYWFHPLVWIAWRQLSVEAERACDDAVLQRAERADYAEQLVMLARRLSAAHAQPALSMAGRSDLSIRVRAVLDHAQPRGRAGLRAAGAALGIAIAFALAVSPIRAVAVAGAGAPPAAARQRDLAEAARERGLALALYEAAERGDTTTIQLLLDGGANVNATLPGDGSPLIAAAREGRETAVRLLLDRGADPDLPVSGDGNALIMAAREGYAAIVALLLDRGASIDLVVPGDENALIQASAEGHLDVVKLLVSRGADINARVWSGREWRTPLSMARREGGAAVVAFLVSAGARN